MSKVKRVGVFTSGGDAPGMNACIRSVVRTAIFNDLEVSGIIQGFEGMIQNNFIEMNSRSVSNIIQLGGTILKTARCAQFKTPEGRQIAYRNLQNAGIDALVGIGGDGTFSGIEILSREFNIPVIAIPGTIDNDLYGSDYTLGYDSACNTVIDAIDKIRDTAASHDRLFFIEVMGRDAGYIALNAGIGGGAEAILLPESEMAIDDLVKALEQASIKKKTSTIVIVAEGDKNGGAYEVAKRVQEKADFYDSKVTILGHLQRGGKPSSFDRVLASRLGYAAINFLLQGETRRVVGIRGNSIQHTDLVDSIRNKSTKVSEDMFNMAKILAI